MYQTSLGQFLGVFDMSMATAPKSPITHKRIFNIIEVLTFEVFRQVFKMQHLCMYTVQIYCSATQTSQKHTYRNALDDDEDLQGRLNWPSEII